MDIEAEEQGKTTEVVEGQEQPEQLEQEEQEGELPPGSEGGEQQDDEDDEVEIVHAGESPSSDEGKKRSAPPRRVRKLLEQKAQLSTEKEQLEYQNRLLRMQLDKSKGGDDSPKSPPTLESVGYDEAKYQQAMTEYLQTAGQSVVTQELTKLQKQQQQEGQKQQRRASLETHYQRADKLKVPDYDDAENAAMEVLGREAVEDIAAHTDDSELVLYYLGKNPGKAAEIKELLDTSPVRATYALGKLSASLSARPKTKSAPKAPDKPVDAGGPSSGNSWEKRLESARDKAAKTGDFSHVQAVKRDARAAGVDL